MPEAPLDAADTARARLRGRRVALALVGAIAVPFIVSSAFQIGVAVFGAAQAPLGAGAPGSPERACSTGVRDLQAALDRASAHLLAPDGPRDPEEGDDVPAPSRPAALAEWKGADTVRRACDAAQGGAQTWAALERLFVTEARLARRARDELAPLRRDVAAHLPAELR